MNEKLKQKFQNAQTEFKTKQKLNEANNQQRIKLPGSQAKLAKC